MTCCKILAMVLYLSLTIGSITEASDDEFLNPYRNEVAKAAFGHNSKTQTLIEDLIFALEWAGSNIDDLNALDKAIVSASVKALKQELNNGYERSMTDAEFQLKLLSEDAQYRQAIAEMTDALGRIDKEAHKKLLQRKRREAERKRSERPGFQTLADQQKIFGDALREIVSKAKHGKEIESTVFIFLAAKKGPFPLWRIPYFNQRFPKTKFKENNRSREEFDKKLLRLKRSQIESYLRSLDRSQIQKLSRRLGVCPRGMVEIADYVTLRGFTKLFSNSSRIDASLGTSTFHKRYAAEKRKVMGRVERFRENDDTDVAALEKHIDDFLSDDLNHLPFYGKQDDCADKLNAIHQELKSKKFVRASNAVGRLRDFFVDATEKWEVAWQWRGFREAELRFYSEEVDPTDRFASTGLKKAFAARSTQNYTPIINRVRANELILLLREENIELLPDQTKRLVNLMGEWSSELEKIKTFRELVDLNNRSIRSLSDVLLPSQSPVVFNYFFCRQGFHRYFQRPDVIAEYGISEIQSKELEKAAAEIRSSISLKGNRIKAESIKSLFSDLGPKEVEKFESELGIKFDTLAKLIADNRDDLHVRHMLDADATFYLPKKFRYHAD